MLSSILYFTLGLFSAHALPQANTQNCKQHEVSENETGYDIAAQYNVDFYTQVAPYNPSVDWYDLQVGDVLQICGISSYTPPSSIEKPVAVVPSYTPPSSNDKPVTVDKSLSKPNLCAEADNSKGINPITNLYSCKTCNQSSPGGLMTLVTDANNENFNICVTFGIDITHSNDRPIFALIDGVYNCVHYDSNNFLKFQPCSTLTFQDNLSIIQGEDKDGHFVAHLSIFTSKGSVITENSKITRAFVLSNPTTSDANPPSEVVLKFSDGHMVTDNGFCVAVSDGYAVFSKSANCLTMGYLTIQSQ